MLLYEFIDNSIDINLRLLTLIHFQSHPLLGNSFRLSIFFASAFLGSQFFNRKSILFIKILNKFLFSLITMLFQFLNFLFTFTLLLFYLLCYLTQHLWIPLELFWTIVSSWFNQFWLFYELLVLMQKNFDLSVT